MGREVTFQTETLPTDDRAFCRTGAAAASLGLPADPRSRTTFITVILHSEERIRFSPASLPLFVSSRRRIAILIYVACK